MCPTHRGVDVGIWFERFPNDLANPLRRFLVTAIHNEVVGYGHTVRHSAQTDDPGDSNPVDYFLAGLLISPFHRRQGIGTRLTIARLDRLSTVTVIHKGAAGD